MKTLVCTTIAVLLLAATTPLFAQDSLRIRLVGEIGYLEEMGQYRFDGGCTALAIQDDLAYVTGGSGFLNIMDISDPSNSETISVFDFDSYPYDVGVSGDYAYIANFTNGLRIVDISNPEEPEEVVHLDNPPYWAYCITLEDDLLFVGEELGFMIYDIEDPVHPEMLNHYRVGFRHAHGNDIVIEGDLAYMAIANFLYTMDISDPTEPEEISHVEFVTENGDEIQVNCIEIDEDLVYLGTRNRGMYAMDISEPENPEEVAHFYDEDEINQIKDIEIRDDLAYISYREGFMIADISDLDNIIIIGNTSEIEGGVRSGTVKLIDNLAFIAGSYFAVYDIANPRSISINNMDIYEDYVLTIGDDVNDLFIFDLSDPENPVEASSINLNNEHEAYDIVVNEDLAFISGFGLLTVDWSDPEAPELLNQLNNDLVSYLLELDGDYLYASCLHRIERTEGLGVFDVSEPGNPELTGFLEIELDYSRIKDLEIDEDYAYVINQYSRRYPYLFIINTRNPESMELVSSYQFGEVGHYAQSLCLSDDIAFVYLAGFGFRIIDVSNPEDPEEVGEYEIPGDGRDVEIIDNIAFIAAGDGGLRLYDVSEWDDIEEIGYYETRKPAGLVSVNGYYAYVKEDSHLRVYNCMTALGINAAPEWIEFPAEPIAVDEQDTVEFVVTADDFNGDTLTLEMESDALPDSLFTDNGDNSGRFYWHTTFADSGVYRPLFIASDRESADTISVEITVRDVNAVGTSNENLPTDFALGAIYPNPFNSTTTIRYEVPFESLLSLRIHDIEGRQVAEPVSGVVGAGFHNIQWNGRTVTSGIYFIYLKTQDRLFVSKIILIK